MKSGQPDLSRRRTLAAAGALLATQIAACGTPFGASNAVAAKNHWDHPFPQREVTLVVPFPTGGVTDINARILARSLAALWRQPVRVVNVQGGGGATGAMQVLGAAKDGYTMMVTATGLATQNPAIDSRFPYAWDAPTPVARTSVSPLVFVVKGDSPWNSLHEVLADVRRNPSSYRYGTSGPGGVGSIAMSLMFAASGVDARQLGRVTLQGGAPLLEAVATGKTHFAVQYLAEMGPQLADRSLKPLAVSTARRVKQLPSVPSGTESGSDSFSLVGWNGVVGPADLPPAILARWSEAIEAVTSDPAFVKETEASGAEVSFLGPEAFRNALRQEYEEALAQVTKLGLRR